MEYQIWLIAVALLRAWRPKYTSTCMNFHHSNYKVSRRVCVLRLCQLNQRRCSSRRHTCPPRWALNQTLICEFHVINYMLRATVQHTQTFTVAQYFLFAAATCFGPLQGTTNFIDWDSIYCKSSYVNCKIVQAGVCKYRRTPVIAGNTFKDL